MRECENRVIEWGEEVKEWVRELGERVGKRVGLDRGVRECDG